MHRLPALAMAVLGLAASPAFAQTECVPGAYKGPGGEVLALTRPEGSPGARYTFVDGRLKVVDRIAAPEPAKPVAKKRGAKPQTAAR